MNKSPSLIKNCAFFRFIFKAAVCGLLSITGITSLVAQSSFSPPEFLTYQGFLADGNGVGLGQAAPVNYNVVFRIFDSQSGGNRLWSELQTVTFDRGQFSVVLGEGSQNASEERPPLGSLFASATASDRFLDMTVTIGGNPLNISPRMRFLPTPYSFLATQANQLVSPTGASLISSDANGNLSITGSINTPGSIANAATTATRANTANAIVMRGPSGSFEASSVFLTGTMNAFNANVTSVRAGGLLGGHLQGAHLEWNYGGQGASYLLNQKGLGSGGIVFGEVDAGTAITERMRIDYLGRVGIGIGAPEANLHVRSLSGNGQVFIDSPPGNASQLFLREAGVLKSAFSYIPGTGSLHIYTGVDAIVANSVGRVGMGTAAPDARLHVVSNASNRASGTAVFVASDVSSMASHIHHGALGDWYIRSAAPTGRIFMQDSGGNVVIGGGDPNTARLVVSGAGTDTFGNHFSYSQSGAAGPFIGGWVFSDVSIKASNGIHAAFFRALSDARIKNIAGQSSSATDLETLRKIEVTDYTHKDVATKGNRPVKKLIGQQLEKIYPQAVSFAVDAIPDIYEMAKLSDGWVKLKTNLEPGQRVRLISKSKEGVFEVLEVDEEGFRADFNPDDSDVFVFGREVSDFRVVDYEAVSMLNVSATQELAKQVEALKQSELKIASLEEKVARLEALESKANRVVHLEQELAELKEMLSVLVDAGVGKPQKDSDKSTSE